MGDIGGENRLDQYLPLSLVRARLQRRWTLDDSDYRTGGPARYVTVRETGRRLGFITPLDPQFLRELQSRSADLHRHALHVPGPGRRGRSAHAAAPSAATRRSRRRSARRSGANRSGHDFIIDRRHNRPAVARHMSVTGG